ncbi:MAG: hypothetical protein IJ498_02185 [Akkermansia sp.]|nr:hypothetical protein [Akkermansia sp.]
MDSPFFPTLPQEVRRQLELCGISSDAQLAAANPATLRQELQAAGELFPEENIRLKEAELESLILKAREVHGLPEILQEARYPEKHQPEFRLQEEETEEFSEEQDEAQLAAEREAFLGQLKPSSKQKGIRKPITCGHPFILLFGAFATILVPFFVLGLIGLPYILLLTDYRPFGDDNVVYSLLVFLLIVPYLILVRMVHCSVCHMHTFTFRNYPHHSKAHRLPLLGVPISTALRIIFFLRYTCPACGTEQKLFGKRSSHRHSHRNR